MAVRWPTAILVLLSGWLGGCQTSRLPSDDHTTFPVATVSAAPDEVARELPQINIDLLFARATALVSEHTGTNLDSVKLQLSSDAIITDEVAHETRTLISSQFTQVDFTNHFLDAVMAGQAGTYAALYTGRQSLVMISETLLGSYRQSLPTDSKTQEAAVLALLIHELVHAADDHVYKIHENRTLNFRASFAQSAAFEGHAQWVTRQICTEHGCLQGLEALDDFMFSRSSEPNQLTQPVQAISRNVLEYSYIEGERFLAALAARPDGTQLIARLLAEPPHDPIQILDPASYPDTAREQRNQQLLAAAAGFRHTWLAEPWIAIETSPLKGVNLRADPARRRAAIDGFTRLITSMVALQLYDQSQPERQPLEVTMLSTDNAETARLFGENLHQNTQLPDTTVSTQQLELHNSQDSKSWPLTLFWTHEPTLPDLDYHTLIAVSGKHVIQLAGFVQDTDTMADFATQAMAALYRQTAS